MPVVVELRMCEAGTVVVKAVVDVELSFLYGELGVVEPVVTAGHGPYVTV